tara:strand:+ start:220 stop:1986 length:1767 start_codon:yes stop_codon:yes gene_type:complete
MVKEQNNISIIQNLIKLWSFINKKRKRHFYLLLLLMIISVFAEILSLGSVIPFIGVLTNPDKIVEINLVDNFIDYFDLSENNLLIIFTILFCTAVLIAGLIRILFLYLSVKLIYLTGTELSSDIYRKCLYQNYETHVSWNSSEIVNAIVVNVNRVIGGVLLPLTNLISSIVILIGVALFLIMISPAITFLSLLFFVSLYALIILFTKKTVEKNSSIIANESSQMIKSIQEGLGNIRDVIINKNHNFYTENYKNSDFPMRKASGINAFIAGSPRLVIEIFGLIFIAFIALFVSMPDEGLIISLPFLTALALGTIRLLPMAQQSYASIISIRGFDQVLKNVNEFLEQEIQLSVDADKRNVLEFNKDLSLQNISFKHAKSDKYILKNCNLKIKKGSLIGFVGETGSGKSTLTDLISGLIEPTDGGIFIDGIKLNDINKSSWQKKISYIPQNIFLADLSIAENIALGMKKEEIDHNLVVSSAKIAQIDDFINSLHNGYQTIVGERGAKISGGQKQRIGIARAIYKRPDLIILDESTNALDKDTEIKVIESLKSVKANLTTIFVAHQGVSLKFCNEIYQVKDGSLLSQLNKKT